MSTTLTYGLVRPATGDKGSTWFPAIEADITQLDAHDHNGTNSPQIGDAAILAAAAIARTKIASGTASHVIINDGSGVLSSEASLAITRGGTGQATAIAGFNALSPVTTKGDVVGTNGTTSARLAVGTDGQVLTADAASTNGIKWSTNPSAPDSSKELTNLTLTASVGSNILTIAIKTKAGADASGGDPVKIGFRSTTAATGTYVQRSITAALSMTVSNGSTLGFATTIANYAYVYAIDNAGTVELAVSGVLFDEGTRQSTTAEGGAGAADSNTVMYSTTARTTVGVRLIGRVLIANAAGAWTTSATEISLQPFRNTKAPTVQKYLTGSGTYTTPAGVSFIQVKMVGGGGGGAGGGGAGATSGSNGVASTFGTTLLSCGLGAGGTANGAAGGAGGAASLGTGPIGTAMSGAYGAPGTANAVANILPRGGVGGATPFSGGGADSNPGSLNSGAGGGGGSGASANASGGGGGAGAFVDAIIFNPLSTYAYAVGTGGAAGAPLGGSGNASAGMDGYIEVREFYH